MGLLLLGLIVMTALAIRRRRRLHGLSIVEVAFEDLVDWVRRLLHLRLLAHQTPHEYAAVVAEAVPKGRQAVEQIADLYVQERFGAKAVVPEVVESAWQQAWSALWRRWVGRRVDRVRRIWRRLVPPKRLEGS